MKTNINTVGSRCGEPAPSEAITSAVMMASVAAMIADGLASGLPMLKNSDVRSDSVNMMTTLPTSAASSARPTKGSSMPPKMSCAKLLA